MTQTRTGAYWTATNPILDYGEIGVELETNMIKVGDGATAWNSLGWSNGDDFTLFMVPGTISPADATTYYFGQSSNVPTTTNTGNDNAVGFAFKVIGAIITTSNNTVQGTSESSTLSLRNNTTATSTSMGSFTTNSTSSGTVYTVLSNLNINVGASDEIAMQWLTPTWVTNPTTMLIRITLICKKIPL